MISSYTFFEYCSTREGFDKRWDMLSKTEKNSLYADYIKDESNNGYYVLESGQYGIENTYPLKNYFETLGENQCKQEIYERWLRFLR